MAAILFLKLAIYFLCKFDEAIAAIFHVLEHLYDFEIIGYGGHFVFQNEAEMVHRQNICRPGLLMGCFYILKP